MQRVASIIESQLELQVPDAPPTPSPVPKPPIVIDPNPMLEILKRAQQLRKETTDGILYPCELCQKVFKFKYEYDRHAKIHSGDRPWQCNQCMKSFSRKDNMHAHMKIHTGELVRHECETCGKSYGRKYDLQVHERVHSGERPFLCASCGKSFISTSRLRAHQLIHCKNIYLPRHVRNKHGIVNQLPLGLATKSQHHLGAGDDPEEALLDESDEQRDVKPLIIDGIVVSSSAESESPVDSPDGSSQLEETIVDDDQPVCLIDVEGKMQQLEAALMQRKAELEERGIKVEIEDVLNLDSHLRDDERRIHIVLPEPCENSQPEDECSFEDS